MNVRFLVVSILMMAASPSPASTTAPAKRVLILRQGECCAPMQWNRGEEALIRELGVIDSHETLAVNGLPVDGNVRYALSMAATRAKADVAIRLYRDRDTMHADIVSWSRSGKTILYQLHFAKETVATEETLSAAVLQIVETVLAGLVAVPPVKPVPLPLETPEPPKSFHRLGVEVGAGALYSPGGVGASFASSLGLKIKPMGSWMILIEGTYAPLTKDIEQGSLSATFDLAMARALLFIEIPAGKRLIVGLGLGAGAAFAWTDEVGGSTSARNQVAWLGGGCRLHVELAPILALVGEARIGGLVPELKVRFDEETVASYGTPLLEFSLGLQFMFL